MVNHKYVDWPLGWYQPKPQLLTYGRKNIWIFVQPISRTLFNPRTLFQDKVVPSMKTGLIDHNAMDTA